MLTEQDKMWFRIYEAQTPEAKGIIDAAFYRVKILGEDRMTRTLPLNDHAEALVAAITRYFVAGAELAGGDGKNIVNDTMNELDNRS